MTKQQLIEINQGNYSIQLQSQNDISTTIRVINLAMASSHRTNVDNSPQSRVLLEKIKMNEFSIEKVDDSLLKISVEIYKDIPHSVELHIEYTSAEDQIRMQGQLIQQVMDRVAQLEQRKPKTKRIHIPLPPLAMIQLSDKPSYSIPIQVSSKTIALILRCKCHFGNTGGHLYLTFNAQQEGSTDGNLQVDKYHYDWYYNNTVEEFIMPWDGQSPYQSLEFKVTDSLCDGTYSNTRVNSNYYVITIEGLMEY